MWSDSLTRLRNALRAGPWLALSLALIPTLGGAAPAAHVEPAALEPAAHTAPARRADPGELAEPAAHAEPAARIEPAWHGELAEPAAHAGPAGHAEPAVSFATKPRIGRIFFSPAERRSRRSSSGLDATPAAAPTDSRPAPGERLIVNGAVSSRSEGRVVWINGAAVDNSTVNKRAWTDRNGNVWVNDGAQRVHLMRPGQSIDGQGAIEDLLPAGSVTRR